MVGMNYGCAAPARLTRPRLSCLLIGGPMSRRSRYLRFLPIVLAAACLCAGAACGDDDSSATPSATASATLVPADASQPAAGACSDASDSPAVITLMPDTPQPRCIRVTSPQKIEVKNDSGKPVDVTLGTFSAHVAPGESHLFDLEVGAYLAAGVHVMRVSIYAGSSGP